MKNILVFPCGSEIGLEIHRSVKHSTFFKLIGASSVDDHGRFVYENYIAHLPFHTDPMFIEHVRKLVVEFEIDAIYPAMDEVARTLKSNESLVGCKVIGSNEQTTTMCASKKETYAKFEKVLRLPTIYKTEEEAAYPLFIKPDIGYGSRNVCTANDIKVAKEFLREKPKEKYLLCEYLSGDEYTVDCFTDKEGRLRFVGPRERKRISNGISVNTKPVKEKLEEFEEIAQLINGHISLRGAWFFQVKRDKYGELTLLEIAARLGGSSSLYRNKGVNFALLSLFDAFEYEVEILENNYDIELDRSLSNRYKILLDFKTIYVDYDDCIVLNGSINSEIIAFLYEQINCQKKIILITKHQGDLKQSLQKFRIESLFDEIIHLSKEDSKADFISCLEAIFIDDSHRERANVKSKLGMAVFAPDMIESLRGCV